MLRIFRIATIDLSLFILLLMNGSGGLAANTEVNAPGSAVSTNNPATVWRVKLLLEKDSPVMEIMATRPIRPAITTTQEPPALRIDLNNARISVQHKQIAVQSPIISGVQVDQLELTPPVVRIVVGQRKPLSYTWDAAGNRLTIRLHLESEEARSKPPSSPVLTSTPEPLAVPVTTSGNAIFADRVVSGSSFSAKFATETLRLSRGGEVHVCPGTTVSILHPKEGPDLMLAMGVGALETHYALENSADSIVTPDFRILLRGPGEFHYAIRTDTHGDTCVRSLPGNTGSAIVYEMMGDGKFEVVPTENLVMHSGRLSASDTAFHSGQLTQVETVLPYDCGCPPPVPVLRAELPASPAGGDNDASNASLPPQPNGVTTLETAKVGNLPTGPETAPLPAWLSNRKPPEIEANLVFSHADARPPWLVDVSISRRQAPTLNMNVAPSLPPQPTKRKRNNVLQKVTRFFSRILG